MLIVDLKVTRDPTTIDTIGTMTIHNQGDGTYSAVLYKPRGIESEQAIAPIRDHRKGGGAWALVAQAIAALGAAAGPDPAEGIVDE